MKVVMLIPIFLMISLAGCGDEPAKYAETGLPSNCRALIAETAAQMDTCGSRFLYKSVTKR